MKFQRLCVAALMGGAGLFCLVSAAHAAELSPTVTIEGIDRNSLRSEMRELSDLASAENTYNSLAAIRRAGKADAGRIVQALTSKGFYAARVEPLYRRAGAEVAVTFEVFTGDRFTISRYAIQYTDKQDVSRPRQFADAGIKTAGNPDGKVLQGHLTSLVTWLQENGFPAATPTQHYVQANFETGNAIAIYEISSGPKAVFGKVVVDGAEQTEPGFIERYVTWEAGTTYRRSKTASYRDALVETGLFREVSVNPQKPLADGTVDILVTVSERKRRTVGAGVSFATDVGAGVQLFWENRNLFGRANRLSTRLTVTAPEQELAVTASRPYPSLPGSLNGTFSIRNEISDAFEAQTIELGSALSRFWFDRRLEVSGGVGMNYSQIEDGGIEDTFFYFTLPANIAWNSDNDVLNPTTGFRTALTVTPYIGDVNFIQAKLTGASRRVFGEDGRYTLAGRGAIGSSFGIDRDDIPATERFFAGGGGSVRGFAFQEAGPLDAVLDPIGGASLVEANIEGRVRVREKVQVAAFVDAGTVSESQFPDFSEEVLVGAGLGARYLTPIGPLRVDVATPLNGRETDDPIQFYIALGQPF
ncbi:MAG: autotransporter assembly complex protein TamA [Aquisalinus sp.]|nr:autotransporter assembly complex protein TamA [Aquisalinus sp.]